MVIYTSFQHLLVCLCGKGETSAEESKQAVRHYQGRGCGPAKEAHAFKGGTGFARLQSHATQDKATTSNFIGIVHGEHHLCGSYASK